MKPVALVSGITGQDGFYLASELLDNGYTVVGTTHRADVPHSWLDASIALERLDSWDAGRMGDLFRRY